MLDLHSHTKFSADSREIPENSIENAIKKGCGVFGFSEHLDYDYVSNGLEVIMTDVDAYYKNTQKLKGVYKNRINLLCGIEFAYDKGAQNNYLDTNNKYAFDYIINSVHLTDGSDCYFKAYFEGKTKQYAYDRYLKQVFESLDSEYDYQIVGHLGYVSRNAPYTDQYLHYDEHKSIIDDILKRVIEKEKTLEINTNVKTCGSPYLPTIEIIKRYYEMGGRLVTFGSDCHQAERVCDKYNEVSRMLKETGFKEYSYYINKKIKFMEI